jgi:pimeloyl-ACP methyl ester carboxylesterase
MRALLLLTTAAICFAAEPCRTATDACLELIPIAGNLKIAAYRSHSLSATQPNLERAVIVVHGTNRDADRYYTGLVAAAEKAGAIEKTLLISPYFRGKDRGCDDQVAAGELYFTCNGWKYGDSALNAKDVYSFTVADRLVEMLADRAKFPKLRAIVVAGHSAGGQFLQRYAAGTRIDTRVRAKVRFVVMNPSSYMYLDARRLRKGATCSEKGTCTGPFQVEGAAEGCASYNQYRYGVEDRNGYMGQTAGSQILKRFPKKDVVYLVGEKDVDRNDPSLDQLCESMKQGVHRRERGTIFWSYMKSLYKARHGFGIAPGCPHNAGCMLASGPGLRALFDWKEQ